MGARPDHRRCPRKERRDATVKVTSRHPIPVDHPPRNSPGRPETRRAAPKLAGASTVVRHPRWTHTPSALHSPGRAWRFGTRGPTCSEASADQEEFPRNGLLGLRAEPPRPSSLDRRNIALKPGRGYGASAPDHPRSWFVVPPSPFERFQTWPRTGGTCRDRPPNRSSGALETTSREAPRPTITPAKGKITTAWHPAHPVHGTPVPPVQSRNHPS